MRDTFLGWKAIIAKLGLTVRKQRKRPQRRYLTRRLCIESLENREMLTTWTVNVDFDEDDGIGDNQISVRDAINVAAAGDRIEFDSSLNGAKITLDRENLGQIDIERSVTIDASMLTSGITIDANDPSSTVGDGIRIFNITDPTNGSAPPLVTLKGLTLKGGDPGQNGNGGAIFSQARLTILDCTIEDNDAYSGGGIHIKVAGGSSTTPRQILTIEDSFIQDNTALIAGGGIDIDSGSTINPTSDTFTITRTTIRDNHALATNIVDEPGGGGVYAELHGARLGVSDCAISGNSTAAASAFIDLAGGGGGLFVQLYESASLTVDKTVLHDNHATNGNGGGILAKAFEDAAYPDPRAITITRSTISENRADDRGGGLYLFNREGTEISDHRSALAA